jgi:hypothetical protein
LSGLERSLAGNLLKASIGNLEVALNMHMENGELYFFPLLSGLERSLAGNLLEACGGNLEMALNMHMENGDPEEPQAGPSQPQRQLEPEDDVRAPIPQKQVG